MLNSISINFSLMFALLGLLLAIVKLVSSTIALIKVKKKNPNPEAELMRSVRKDITKDIKRHLKQNTKSNATKVAIPIHFYSRVGKHVIRGVVFPVVDSSIFKFSEVSNSKIAIRRISYNYLLQKKIKVKTPTNIEFGKLAED